jgi:hypothetical protein
MLVRSLPQTSALCFTCRYIDRSNEYFGLYMCVMHIPIFVLRLIYCRCYYSKSRISWKTNEAVEYDMRFGTWNVKNVEQDRFNNESFE